MEVSDDL